MEGWDAEPDGRPPDLVRRRWRRFGASGAKLVWGGEATAVRPDGRANPHQLVLDRTTVDDIAALRADLVGAHVAAIGSDDGLVVGLQLTHSGRWSRPTGAPQPRIAYHHPLLDRRVGRRRNGRSPTTSSTSSSSAYVDAAVLAADAGLRLRRREALPRLPAPRAARRARPAGRLRRVVRASAPRSSDAWSRASGARPGARDRRAAVGVRPRALRSRRGRRRRAGARRSRRSLATRSAATRRAAASTSPRPTASSTCAASSASASCASPPAARTTTRTSSGRRSSRPPTATPRPRIRSSARPA